MALADIVGIVMMVAGTLGYLYLRYLQKKAEYEYDNNETP